MRLVNKEFGFEFQLTENTVLNIVCENRNAFKSMVFDFYSEAKGDDGAWILSDNDEEHCISKRVEVIVNPFSISCNDRKILNAVYKELHDVLEQKYCEAYSEVNSRIFNLIDTVLQNVPYPLVSELSGDIEGLFKLYDVKFDEEYTSLAERIISYIKTSSQVLKKKVYVLVNIKTYLDDNEMKQLYKEAMYNKAYLVILESKDTAKLDEEKKVVLDDDLCIIES